MRGSLKHSSQARFGCSNTSSRGRWLRLRSDDVIFVIKSWINRGCASMWKDRAFYLSTVWWIGWNVLEDSPERNGKFSLFCMFVKKQFNLACYLRTNCGLLMNKFHIWRIFLMIDLPVWRSENFAATPSGTDFSCNCPSDWWQTVHKSKLLRSWWKLDRVPKRQPTKLTNWWLWNQAENSLINTRKQPKN